MCKLKKVRSVPENRNELDKLFENYEGCRICKEVDTGPPVGKEVDELDKTAGERSPEISWSDYKKTIFSPEEIAAADAKVAKMRKKIEKKQRRRGL